MMDWTAVDTGVDMVDAADRAVDTAAGTGVDTVASKNTSLFESVNQPYSSDTGTQSCHSESLPFDNEQL